MTEKDFSDFSDFPGFLGLTSNGIIAIHANWPMYSDEHGWELALLALAYYPPKTIFYKIDDIDRCILFFVGDMSNIKNPFDEKYYHVALWHEDLVELLSLGYVTGIDVMTEYKWDMNRFNQIPKDAYVKINDQVLKLEPPSPLDLDDEDYDDSLSWVVVKNDGLTVTDKGYETLQKLLANEKDNLNPKLMEMIQPLIDIGKYDSAIREAAIHVETRIREIVDTDAYGMVLVDQFFSILFKSKKYVSAKLKIFRSEIRTAFKFIRNDYAHNIKVININQCYAILWRLSSIITTLENFKL